MTPLPQLKRVRWGVRGALALGVAASVAANVLAARQNVVSQVIAAWSPLALLVTVEMISRVPVAGRVLSAVRLSATAVIAGIAAWVSYWHMAHVASEYGEAAPSHYLLPFAVDGLIVVASVSLVELARLIRVAEDAPAPAVPVAAPRTEAPANAPAIESSEQVTAHPKRQPGRQRPPAPRQSASDLAAEARRVYTQSVVAEMPLTGAALGRMFERSAAWGRERIAEAKQAADAPVVTAPDVDGG